MSIVDTHTGEVIEFDRAAAERRAERIRLRLDSIADNYAAVMPMIREAIEKRDDLALGYRSVGEYVQDRFGGALTRLGADVRREVVHELTEAGMSTRAIAPVVGVGQRTIVRDLHSGESSDSPEPQAPESTIPQGEPVSRDVDSGTTPQGEAAPSMATEVPSTDKPRPAVTGIDGKTYKRPEPKPRATPPAQRRKPYLDDLAGVVHALTGATERLQSLMADARYSQNAEQAATENRDDLIRIVGALQSAVQQMS